LLSKTFSIPQVVLALMLGALSFPMELFSQYTGGEEWSAYQATVSMNPACNLPPFVPSDIYSGGASGNLASQSISTPPSCVLPPFIASDIYRGGSSGAADALSLLTTGSCNLPVFVASDIYKGGEHDTLGRAFHILFTCGQAPPPPPNIYTGGEASLSYTQKIISSGLCAIPVAVSSDIYVGGGASESGAVRQIMAPACGLPPVAVSDIYRGGGESGNTVERLEQTASCGIAAPVTSTIYRGGASDGTGTVSLTQTLACVIPPIATQGLYGGGGDFATYRAQLHSSCPQSPPVVLEPYRGGSAGTSGSVTLAQTPSCGLPPAVASDIYRGGSASEAAHATQVQSANCGLPNAVVSHIYSGGTHGDLTRAEVLTAPACALPVVVQSDIYRGGSMGANHMDSLSLACGSGSSGGPVVSNIYTGGVSGNQTQVSVIQSPACALPLAVSSDIYRGGAAGIQTSAEQLQSSNCSLPVVVASDIYRGGSDAQLWEQQALQSGGCNLPVFVPSAIYAGGIGAGYGSVTDEISLVASVSLPNSLLSICAGETVTLSASTNGSGSLSWAINGQFAFNGNPGIFSSLSNSDTITATFVSALSCVQSGSNLTDTAIIQVTPALGMNVIFASPDVLCFGSTGVPVTGSAVTGGGTLSYAWEQSADLQVWQSVSGQDTSIFTGSITDTTWYRRLVTASDCFGVDTSNIVEVRVSPPPSGLFSGTTQTGACHVAFVDGWVLFPSSSNPAELLLSIRSINNGFNPAETQVTGYLLNNNPLIDGFRVLNRSYDIVPQNNGAAKVQFYFTQSDLNDLSTTLGSTIQAGNLLVSRFPTGQDTSGQIIQPDTVIANFPFPGSYTVEITVPGFSSFYIHGPDPAPLPVVLKNFQAECREDGMVLNWTTASEINNRRFIVQQSVNAENWETLGEVDGLGTSSTGKSYAWFAHKSSISGIYFRLIQEDFDGSRETFPALAKICDRSVSTFSVHPNPAPGNTTLFIDAQLPGSGELSLMSATGRVLWEKSLEWEAGVFSREIDLNGFSSGVYLLILREPNGQVNTLRIVNQIQ